MYHCGPKYFPTWLRKTMSKKFNASCRWHDDNYKYGSDRRMADKRFLIDMITESHSSIDVLQAVLYYLIVRTFGRFHWSNK